MYPTKTYVKRTREIPPYESVPQVSWECNVLKSAAATRFEGQIMDGGATRKRLQMPPIDKPISWVDMTINHWSVFGQETNQKGEVSSTLKLTAKIRILIVENLLDGDDLGLNIESVRTNMG